MKNYEVEDIVKKIAHKLENYEEISKAQTKQDRIVWNKLTLSHGLPGICMLFGKLMDCDAKEADHWEAVGRQYMGYIVEDINQNGITDMSLYSGLAGVGLAAACLSKDFKDYTKLSAVINQTLSNWVLQVAKTVSFEQGTHSVVYDVIAGMTGVLSYLSLFPRDAVSREGLECGLDMLIAMSKDIQIQGVTVPGWYIPSENQFTQAESLYFPQGNFNTGMAHGIAGPLTLLSEMALKGIVRPGQMEAIQKMTEFLVRYKISERERTIWNGQIDFQEVKEGMPRGEKVFHRDAWCYGTPGICYALIRSTLVCQDRALLSFCIDNLKRAVADMEGIASSTICHGFSGVYLILDAAEQLLQGDYFVQEKKMLKNKILSLYDESARYGFQDVEYDGNSRQLQSYDTCGFLNGAAGVVLGLYSVEKSQKNIWKRAILLV